MSGRVITGPLHSFRVKVTTEGTVHGAMDEEHAREMFLSTLPYRSCNVEVERLEDDDES